MLRRRDTLAESTDPHGATCGDVRPVAAGRNDGRSQRSGRCGGNGPGGVVGPGRVVGPGGARNRRCRAPSGAAPAVGWRPGRPSTADRRSGHRAGLATAASRWPGSGPQEPEFLQVRAIHDSNARVGAVRAPSCCLRYCLEDWRESIPRMCSLHEPGCPRFGRPPVIVLSTLRLSPIWGRSVDTAGTPREHPPDAPCARRTRRERAPGPRLLALVTDGGSCTIIDA